MLYEKAFSFDPEAPLDYSLFVSGEGAGLVLALVPEIETPFFSSEAQIQFINLVPGYDELVISTSPDDFVQVDYAASSAPVNLEAGEHEIVILPIGDSEVIYRETLSFEANTIYDVMVLEGTDSPIEFRILERTSASSGS